MTKKMSTRRWYRFLTPHEPRQDTYVLVSLMNLILVSLMIGGFFVWFRSEIGQALYKLSISEVAQEGIHSTVMALFGGIFLLLILTFFAHFVYVMKMLHHLNGPLIAIRRHVEHLVDGQFDSKCTIRTEDDLQDLAHSLNILAQKLREGKLLKRAR